jgi:rubrerythrin
MTENDLRGVSVASGVQEETQALSSRRRFLAGSAALLAGGALTAVLPSSAQAHDTKNPPRDIDVLNYALTLEHLEATFYVQGLKKFADAFSGAQLANLKRIRSHEVTHVETLKDVIKSLGGRPVPPSTYNFKKTAFTTKSKFLSVAQFLENTGVKAYDGAIAHIEAAALLRAGATIATVEARHASYLNFINGDVPFPQAFDTPVAPRKICQAIQAENGGFIVSSPKPYGPYASLDKLCSLLPTTTA